MDAHQHQHQHQMQHPHQMPMPASATQDPAELLLEQFPEAGKLSREDIEEMLRTPAYFDAFMGTLPQTVALRKEHRDLLERNQALADKNMQLRQGHEALKRDTQAAFDDARSLQARWHKHVVPAQAEAYKRFAPNVQLARLRTALSDHDRLSEHLVNSLSEGTITPDDFARQFKEIRRVYYRRHAHADKFANGQVEWRV